MFAMLYPQDWDWLWLVVVLSAGAPLVGGVLMYFIKLTMGKNASFKIDLAAPYRDGQLGYVVVSWVAAALLEMKLFTSNLDNLQLSKKIDAELYARLTQQSHSWNQSLTAACYIVGGLAALCAANGAVNPVEKPAADLAWYLYPKHYITFIQSAVTCVVGFVVVNIAHNQVLGGMK